MSEILTEHQRINIIAKVITFVLWYIGYRVKVMVMVFNVTFNNISVISWRTVLLVWEIGVKPPICRKSLTNIHIMLYRVHLAWAGFELTALVEIGTDCVGTSNYHTITTVSILYILTMVLSVLRFTDSEYTFDIFKHFLKFMYLTLFWKHSYFHRI